MNVAIRIDNELIDLTDDELKERLAKNLRVIRDGLAMHKCKPTKDGLVPEGTTLPPAFMGSLSGMERRSQEVVRIRELLPAREEARKEKAEQDAAWNRTHLEQALAHAPGDAERLAEAAAEAMPGVERVRQFIDDLNAMARASTYSAQMAQIEYATLCAAKGIGENPPNLAELPDGLPDRTEVQAAVALLSGRTDGFSSGRIRPTGNYYNVDEIARRMQ